MDEYAGDEAIRQRAGRARLPLRDAVTSLIALVIVAFWTVARSIQLLSGTQQGIQSARAVSAILGPILGAGIFTEDDRVELLGGPPEPPRLRAVHRDLQAGPQRHSVRERGGSRMR
jgi:hypothetical protein